MRRPLGPLGGEVVKPLEIRWGAVLLGSFVSTAPVAADVGAVRFFACHPEQLTGAVIADPAEQEQGS
jgi:hypothetical protein